MPAHRIPAGARDDPDHRRTLAAFLQGLQNSAGSRAGNVAIDIRWADGQPDAVRKHAAELSRARARRGCDRGARHASALAAKQRPDGADRVRRWSPTRSARASSQPRAAGRQRHGFIISSTVERQMAGTATRDRAGRHARRQCFVNPTSAGDRPIRAQSSPWRRRSAWKSARSTCATRAEIEPAVARSAVRATGAIARDVERIALAPSRADRRARGPSQAARGLHRRSFVASRRPDSYGPDLVDQYRRAAGLRRPHPQGREAGRPAGAGSRPSTSWSSISRPPRRSASTFRRRCSPAPTR